MQHADDSQSNKVQEYLQSKGIDFTLHTHPAVFTCEDSQKLNVKIPGIDGKNLFLKNKKSVRHFLVVLPAKKRADLKQIAQTVGEKKVSFASAEALQEKLQLTPGSVSPFGLINDPQAQVEVFIDQEIYDAEIVNFHPNINTASLELTKEMFHKYLETLPHKIQVVVC